MKEKQIIENLKAINRLQKELLRDSSNNEDAFFKGFNKNKITDQIKALEREVRSLELSSIELVPQESTVTEEQLKKAFEAGSVYADDWNIDVAPNGAGSFKQGKEPDFNEWYRLEIKKQTKNNK